MKKMILTMAIAISSLTGFADTTISKPVAANGVENVSEKVLDAFKTEFNTVNDVEWTIGSDYYKASFVYNEKHVFAFYNMDGELLGLTRYISPIDLPLNLQVSLKKNNDSYWISDLFEVAKNGMTSYYITIENADTKTVLKSTGGNDWEKFKTVKKS
jgi:CRISPR/Cas system-associated exonuclease Cas4 (RecB family)